MPFCKFESLGFIINLGITLLLCGLIMFYVRQRFAAYDRHLSEQSQLLKHLVSNIQTTLLPSNELATSSAIKAAQKFHDEKIVVSDDEVDDESDSESNEDTESDSDMDSNSGKSDNDNENQKKNNDCDILGKCPILPFGNMFSTLLTTKSLNKNDKFDKDTDEDTESDESSNSSDDSLSDVSINKDEFKHIDFNTNSGEVKVLENIDLTNLDIHNLDNSVDNLSNNVNVLDEIHITKLNDSIEKDSIDNKNNNSPLNIKDLQKKSLQDLCKERKLPTSGTREELIKRLSQ